MKIIKTFKMSLTSMRKQGFRTILASLGVVLGVGAVIGMLAIGEGARQESLKIIEKQGIDNIFISSIRPNANQSQSQAELMIQKNKPYGITLEDVEYITTSFDNIAFCSPIHRFDTPIYNNGKKTNSSIIAVSSSIFKFWDTESKGFIGRTFNSIDDNFKNDVCILGSKVAYSFFPYQNALEKDFLVGDFKLKVISVIDPEKYKNLPDSLAINQQIFIPLNTAKNIMGNNKIEAMTYAHYLYIKVKDIKVIENTYKRLNQYFKKVHKEKDYKITFPFQLLQQAEKQQQIFSIVMGSIATISLLIGGIGIMNIMLANVFERTKEIGTRKALGAQRSDIIIQFLIESVAMTFMGGTIGLFLGIAISFLVEKYASMPTIITASSVFVSLIISILCGIIFGTYPAIRASKLSPIEALQHN